MTTPIIGPTREPLWALVLTVGLGLTPASAEGQTFLPDPVERATVAVQLEKPFLLLGVLAASTYSWRAASRRLRPSRVGR